MSEFELAVDCYYGSNGQIKNEAKALAMLESIAELCDVQAIYFLAVSYESKSKIISSLQDQYKEKSLNYFQMLASQDGKESAADGIKKIGIENFAAIFYKLGLEFLNDVKFKDSSTYYFERAIELGFKNDSCFYLYGMNCYHSKEYEKAFNSFNKSVGLPLPRYHDGCIFMLAVMYQHGNYVNKNYVKSVELFKKIHNFKLPDDFNLNFHIGSLYEVGGYGLKIDITKANGYFKKAAKDLEDDEALKEKIYEYSLPIGERLNSYGKYIKDKIISIEDHPDEFICPISYDLLIDPVLLPDGHTYNKDTVIKMMIKNKQYEREKKIRDKIVYREYIVSPLNQIKLYTDVENFMIPNRSLAELIIKYIDEKAELILKYIDQKADLLLNENSGLPERSITPKL